MMSGLSGFSPGTTALSLRMERKVLGMRRWGEEQDRGERLEGRGFLSDFGFCGMMCVPKPKCGHTALSVLRALSPFVPEASDPIDEGSEGNL